MNLSDQKAVVRELQAIIEEHQSVSPTNPVVVFGIDRLFDAVKNVKTSTRRQPEFVGEVNDLLSQISVCRELGGIYTVCEYELRLMFLIRADLAASVDSSFDPSSKVIERRSGSFLS